jgi:hypothetical protein
MVYRRFETVWTAIERQTHNRFTAHGIGENHGHVLPPQIVEMMEKLRVVFAEWYNNGHTNESDPNTILQCIRLTEGMLGIYDLDFKY